MIQDLNNIDEIIKKEKLDIIVVSYGGSCCNILSKTLEKNNYKCITPIWKKILCHNGDYINTDIPIIYIYDNPIKSFMSMKRRNKGYWDLNQKKLSNNENIELSDENLIKLMIQQYKNWTNIKRDNVLIIKTEELFQNNIVLKLNKFLNTKIKHFPIKYVAPKTKINNITDKNLISLFEKYKSDLLEIIKS